MTTVLGGRDSGEIIADEGRLLLAAARRADPATIVPGTSGRSVEQAVRHVASECSKALACIGVRLREEERAFEDPNSLLAARLAELLGEVGTRDPAQPCRGNPERDADHTIGEWVRRVLHVTTVHRVDVESAVDADVTPIPPETATDGIDDVFCERFELALRQLAIVPSGPWTVAVSTPDRRWHVSGHRHGISAARIFGEDDRVESDAEVDGDAASVYLWLWGRLPNRAVRTHGDPDAVAALWSLLQLVTD